MLGLTSAIGVPAAATSIPRSFGASIHATGSAELALSGFLIFYITCVGLTWWFYARRTAPAASAVTNLAEAQV